MKLKSDIETDRHSRNLGDGSRRDNIFRLVASHNHKISWDGYERFTLTSDQPAKASLDWRESGSPWGRRSSWTESHRPIDKIMPEKGKSHLRNRRLADFSVIGELWERSLWLSQWAFDGANKGNVSTHFSPCKHQNSSTSMERTLRWYHKNSSNCSSWSSCATRC